MDVMDRDHTIDFLNHHVKTDMLMKHLFTVEAAMRGYARKYGEDEDRWGIAGAASRLRLGNLSHSRVPPHLRRRNPPGTRLPGRHHPRRPHPRRAYRHPPRVPDGTYPLRGGRACPASSAP